MKFLKSLDSIFILAITLLFVYDFFPDIPFADAIPKGVLIILILVCLVFSLLSKKHRNPDNKTTLKWQIFLTLYIMMLMVIFPLLGGKSSSGISFDSEFLWIIILIALFDIYSQWKKVKRSEA
ncbi:hypothetical protein [Ureibacillus aquaedulcis]|uniref:YoqO-like protein n=1 Tax=Ureibacillus aquaedulcis TaxID=3058421 RepID=A0ABT8GSF7_9BACL|nr:hypothetical protein [Ureibacillus sp. BA0131]MDN4494346.1 hypothetical protein [Ureibacillus sp. BA0131]